MNGHFKLSQTWSLSSNTVSYFLDAVGLEQRKKETEKYHNVFYEEKNVCNRGRARYQLDLAPIENFPVSDDFAAAVGVLPQNYDEKVYFNFIERWGTVSMLQKVCFICIMSGTCAGH